MDLYNNKIGREIGASTPSYCFDDEISRRVIRAITGGILRRIITVELPNGLRYRQIENTDNSSTK